MKKALPFIIASAILLSGCSGTPSEVQQETEDYSTAEIPETTDSTESIEEPQISSAEQSSEESEPEPELPDSVWEGELPSMDGSTSAIPLEAGIKSKLLGIPYSKALELVNHNKTHISFQNLLDGTVDLIFTVPISAEQQQKADEANVQLTAVPAAKEGFVFVVNKDNPVESLTQQQIKDIYSGKITNWKEVGGNDAEIIPYQRNLDSGSQNYMVEFMGDTPLMQAKTELYPAGMGALMDRIALYDNSVDSIGYSVYSYAAQMYANENKVKFIAVDGVPPTKETMSDDSYPLSSCTYIMYTDKADENTRKFAEWVSSDEGQLCVLQSGYLPVNGMEIPAEYLPYSAVGTGKPKPTGYKPSEQYSFYYDYHYDVDVNGGYEVDFLADEEFQQSINDDIAQAVNYIVPFKPERTGEGNSSTDDEYYSGLHVKVTSINGYLSVLMYYYTPGVDYNPFSEYEFGGYSKAVSLVYDLIEQKRITDFSNLFYEGENYVPMLNNALAEGAEMYTIDTTLEQKSDFCGLLGDVEVFSLSGVCLNEGNTYFVGTPLLSFENCDPIKDSMVVWEYRDVRGIFTEEPLIFNAPEYIYGNYEEDGVYYTCVESSRFHTDGEIAELNEKRSKMEHKAAEYYKSIGLNPYKMNVWYDERCGLYYNSYYQFEASDCVYFDGETCEMLTPEELLCEDWKDYFSEDVRDKNIRLFYISAHSKEGLDVAVYGDTVGDNSGTIWESATIPYDKVNPKYFSNLTFN